MKNVHDIKIRNEGKLATKRKLKVKNYIHF